MKGTRDEYEATWRQDAKLVPVPRIDPSVQLSDGRPLASRGVIDTKIHKPTSLFFNQKAGEVIRQLPDEVT